MAALILNLPKVCVFASESISADECCMHKKTKPSQLNWADMAGSIVLRINSN